MFAYKQKIKPLKKFLKETQHFIIYKHICTATGKCYVGQTCGTMEKRWRVHVRDSKKDKPHFLFQCAIKKYGEDAWEHEILEEVQTELFANASEMFWIEKFQSANQEFGYNLTYGGEGGGVANETTRQKISVANKGRKLTLEHSQKISDSLIGREFSAEHKEHLSQSRMGEDNSFFGKTHTKEFKNNLSTRMSKPISQFDKNGNFIATYSSMSMAMKIVGGGHIGEVCNGTRKYACGYIWKWA